MGSVTIGTGGRVFVPLTQPLIHPALRIQTFCHAPQTKWYLLGAMLSAGMALRWLRAVLGREKVSYEELVQLASEVEPGSEGLFFLPYLVGERSPLMDPKAKAGFIGLALRHHPGHFVRALLEGVAFALRQIVDTMVGCADLTRLVASGNGLANPIWRQIVADILNRPLCQGTGEQASERAGVGAAMIAGIGSGVFDGYQDAQKLAPIFNVVTEPNRNTAALYESHYRKLPGNLSKNEELESDFAVHLDHGDEATCYDCIESGFYSSVMIDSSHEPFEENVATTKRMVERAHAKGLSVEAELGRSGGGKKMCKSTRVTPS